MYFTWNSYDKTNNTFAEVGSRLDVWPTPIGLYQSWKFQMKYFSFGNVKRTHTHIEKQKKNNLKNIHNTKGRMRMSLSKLEFWLNKQSLFTQISHLYISNLQRSSAFIYETRNRAKISLSSSRCCNCLLLTLTKIPSLLCVLKRKHQLHVTRMRAAMSRSDQILCTMKRDGATMRN